MIKYRRNIKKVIFLQGTVFDIQRFSVHDGPGIRTTVFMKGCPLRCRWCHNPEGLSKNLQLQFFESECIGCGACGKREKLSDAENCPANAVKVCGRIYETDEVVREILKDHSFYMNNGGVTFSGGECLLQADFVCSVLKEIKKLGIHTAIDTCGYVPAAEIEKTLEFCDIYLYDVKCITASLHKEYTGVENTLILENLRKLSGCGKEIWARIPVIPGFNNTREEMEKISDFISDLRHIKKVTPIPYHSLGISKYKTLGLTPCYDSSLKVSEEEMADILEIMKSRNLEIV